MSPEEQSAIWCVTPEEPWFLALLRKLDDHIEDAADIVCMPQTAQNPGLLAHSAGSLSKQISTGRRATRMSVASALSR
jgi:hypothetical protein